MNTFQGISASGGIAKGKAFVLSVQERKKTEKIPITADKIPEDWERFENSRKKTSEYFKSLIDQTNSRQAAIFQTYVLMLSDPDFIAQIKAEHAKQLVHIEWIVENKAKEYADMLRSSGDSYLIERAEDISDVYGKVIENLAGKMPLRANEVPPNAILSAEFLNPSDAVLLSKQDLAAIVLHKGAPNSHLAILARTYGIPLVFGIEDIEKRIHTGDEVIVDGTSGLVFVKPDAAVLKEYDEKIAEEAQERTRLAALSDKAARTKDGISVNLYANIGSAEEARLALEEGADGIGLFRTEFLFMQSGLISEERQFEEYRSVLEIMKDKPVVIRTLDAGGDKIVDIPGFSFEEEKNPLLGCRAIRLCLKMPDIFKTQLRALFRASVYGSLKIMLPLITDIEQVREAKALIEEVKAELKAEHIPFKEDVPVGIMIETPAAAIMADELAKEAAFFSIGSNDLTQYGLCVDRENAQTAGLFNELHPAIRRLIVQTAKAAQKEGIPLSVCGEMAADTIRMTVLMSAGVDSFSVAPKKIAPLKEHLLRLTAEQIEAFKEWTESAMDAHSLEEKLNAFLSGTHLNGAQ
ncbi:phosphoenolpyruvate--protein phosphotransferase [Treponema sp. OMZ 840]|uniref:phosphoenolpyruvate--protein phosphotransferase n=1 Tax=Treponema sp. OMZ 840 TaxID=244313 RepID=UPI003D8BA522